MKSTFEDFQILSCVFEPVEADEKKYTKISILCCFVSCLSLSDLLCISWSKFKSNHLYCFSQIPNPLFDLAGITCGHFLVPFWTFFGATLIGKAVIKMHIQVSCCSLVIIINTIIIIHPCKNYFTKKQNEETPIKYCGDQKVLFHRTHVFYDGHCKEEMSLYCTKVCVLRTSLMLKYAQWWITFMHSICVLHTAGRKEAIL